MNRPGMYLLNNKDDCSITILAVLNSQILLCSDSGGFSRSSSIQSETSIPAPPGPPVKLRELPHLR